MVWPVYGTRWRQSNTVWISSLLWDIKCTIVIEFTSTWLVTITPWSQCTNPLRSRNYKSRNLVKKLSSKYKQVSMRLRDRMLSWSDPTRSGDQVGHHTCVVIRGVTTCWLWSPFTPCIKISKGQVHKPTSVVSLLLHTLTGSDLISTRQVKGRLPPLCSSHQRTQFTGFQLHGISF